MEDEFNREDRAVELTDLLTDEYFDLLEIDKRWANAAVISFFFKVLSSKTRREQVAYIDYLIHRLGLETFYMP